MQDRYYWYPVEYGAVSSLYAAGEPGAAERNGQVSYGFAPTYVRAWLIIFAAVPATVGATR